MSLDQLMFQIRFPKKWPNGQNAGGQSCVKNQICISLYACSNVKIKCEDMYTCNIISIAISEIRIVVHWFTCRFCSTSFKTAFHIEISHHRQVLAREGTFCVQGPRPCPWKFEWNIRWVIFKRSLVIGGWGISCEIPLRWMVLNLTDDKSTLVG